jgi:hypothetical protein
MWSGSVLRERGVSNILKELFTSPVSANAFGVSANAFGVSGAFLEFPGNAFGVFNIMAINDNFKRI